MPNETRKHKAYDYWSFEWLTTSLSYLMGVEQEKRKEPAEKRSPSHTSPLTLYAVVSSTNPKAQAPNPKDYTGTNSSNEKHFQHPVASSLTVAPRRVILFTMSIRL